MTYKFALHLALCSLGPQKKECKMSCINSYHLHISMTNEMANEILYPEPKREELSSVEHCNDLFMVN